MLAAVRKADIAVLGYAPGAGTDSYRRKLETYYQRAGIPARFKDIMVTTAGSEAILFAMLTCLNPGDEVIVAGAVLRHVHGLCHRGRREHRGRDGPHRGRICAAAAG